MSSSGGSYSGPISSPVGPPIPGLPVAGANSTIGSPYEYGKFQNFLPDVQASGPNPSATGLRPDMFTYRSPSGVVAQGGLSGEIQGLRDQLAQLQASSQGAGGGGGASDFNPTGGWYDTPEGQYFVYEQQQLAKKGPQPVQQPTYQPTS
jgi:hypothetical protein